MTTSEIIKLYSTFLPKNHYKTEVNHILCDKENLVATDTKVLICTKHGINVTNDKLIINPKAKNKYDYIKQDEFDLNFAISEGFVYPKYQTIVNFLTDWNHLSYESNFVEIIYFLNIQGISINITDYTRLFKALNKHKFNEVCFGDIKKPIGIRNDYMTIAIQPICPTLKLK
jgi:hypothetical protein